MMVPDTIVPFFNSIVTDSLAHFMRNLDGQALLASGLILDESIAAQRQVGHEVSMVSSHTERASSCGCLAVHAVLVVRCRV